MSLSDVLGRLQPYRPRALPSMTPIAAAVERVLANWPDLVREPPESDRERIVMEMKRRLDTGDWRNLHTSFVTSAAVALFDDQRRSREDLGPLRQFYYDEIVANDSKAFLNGMLAVYLGSYHPGATHTVKLGRALSQVSAKLGDRWRTLLSAVPRLLDGTSAHEQVGQLMLGMPSPWKDLKSIGMRKPHDPGLMTHAHLSFVEGMSPSLKFEASVHKLLEWLKPEGALQAKKEGAAQAISALLSPWQNAPPDDLQRLLTTRLTSYYGDPRTRGSEAPWGQVSPDLVERISRWLTGENIQFFMDVVSAVETSHMWEPRRRFWLQLHKERRIDGAWVALSDDGARRAREMAQGRPGLAFGRQTAGGSRVSTCLLVLKIGTKIVVEGSHSYKVHVFKEGHNKTPRLYQPRYDCEDIRLIPGADARAHNGDWQGWVRERI
jgi:hypothetical protein